jgi:hypothetical protein
MVAKRHKITNVPLLKKLWDIIFFFGTILSRKKKIMSRIFLNSGTLIVIKHLTQSLIFFSFMVVGQGGDESHIERNGCGHKIIKRKNGN